MNGTPIDNIRYQQNHVSEGEIIQTGDGFLDDVPVQQNRNMNQLANEVNNTLNEIDHIPAQPPIRQHTPEVQTKPDNGIMKNIPVILRDPIILMIVYIILSLDIVKKTIATYIPQLTPDPSNGVSMMGIVIYAAIVAFSYTAIKKLLL